MALPSDYEGQDCSLARALEIVGERWTLLVVRDAFFGVRRFSDFAAHLGIPRAVLTQRLAGLVEQGVLAREPAPGGRDEYVLTAKGLRLWPVVRSLSAFGDEFYAPAGPRRVFRHLTCGVALDATGRCGSCGMPVPPAEVVVAPGPGLPRPRSGDDAVTVALRYPRRLLQPVRG